MVSLLSPRVSICRSALHSELNRIQPYASYLECLIRSSRGGIADPIKLGCIWLTGLPAICTVQSLTKALSYESRCQSHRCPKWWSDVSESIARPTRVDMWSGGSSPQKRFLYLYGYFYYLYTFIYTRFYTSSIIYRDLLQFSLAIYQNKQNKCLKHRSNCN